MSTESHDHNGKYVRVETCGGRSDTINLRFARNEGNINNNTKDIEKIYGKINATLVFAVATLVGLVLIYIKV